MRRFWMLLLIGLLVLPALALAEEEADFGAEEEAAGSPGEHLASLWDDLNLQLYVDLIYEHQQESDASGFDSNHTLAFLSGDLTDRLSFEVDLNFEYQYEMRYRFCRHARLRAGKILVPFGQYEGHTVMGGRIYEEPNGVYPYLFYDFGLGLDLLLHDGESFSATADLALVNGFRELGGSLYMDAQGTEDNNHQKAVALKLQGTWWNRYQLTLSAYRDRWDDDGHAEFQMAGLDLALGRGFLPVPGLDRLKVTGGYIQGRIASPDESLNTESGWFDYQTKTGGCYGALDYKLNKDWRVVLLGGRLDPDVNDDTQGGDMTYSASVYFKFARYLEAMVQYRLDEELDGPELDDDTFLARLRLRI